MCRTKPNLPSDQTDRELFTDLAMHDVWVDADMYSVFELLWESSRTSVPDSWQTCMSKFREQFRSMVLADQDLVRIYNSLPNVS